jgi:8-amino-7-oxononanoate synthase
MAITGQSGPRRGDNSLTSTSRQIFSTLFLGVSLMTNILPPLMESPPGPETLVDGVKYLYFAGTSYLGLHGDSRVISAGCRALERFGVHTATSRAGLGSSQLLLDVEQEAASFFKKESAFYFSTGYSANHILVQAIANDVDAVYIDSAAHYSIQEAARLFGKQIQTFSHSAGSLQPLLRRNRRPLVLLNGVDPATGGVAPVHDFIDVLCGHAATLHLDDSHGVGVLGTRGNGTWEHHGLWSHVNGGSPIDGVRLTMSGTLAKALGGFGGIIPGTREFIDKVKNSSHYFSGASAPANPLAACSLEGIRIVQREPERRERLKANVRKLRAGLRALGISVTDEPSANVGVVIRDAVLMKQLHSTLKQRSILVPYVASYSGTGAEGIVRFALCSEHTPDMINQLLFSLRELIR